MAGLLNLVRVVSATVGPGTLTLGAQVLGFNDMTAAGGVDGATYSYAIEADYVAQGDDFVATSREQGRGVWDFATNTLTRNVVSSTDGDALLNLAGDAQVIIAPLADDIGSGSGVSDGDYGDITVSGSNTVWTIDNDVVSNAKLANMAEATIKGRAAGAGTGDPTDLTAAQLVTIINTADGAGSGLDADLLDGQSSAFYATATSVSDHIADASDAHDASAISFAPAGAIAATDVQAAIEELDTEKQPLDADLTAIAALATTTAGRSGLTVADPNVDRLSFWDDSAGTLKLGAIADFTVEAAPANGDKVFIQRAGSDDLAIVDWADLPAGSGSGTPGGNDGNIQYKSGASFAGDDDLMWVAGSGLTVLQHAAIGSHARLDGTIDIFPGDVVETFSSNVIAALIIDDFVASGDFGGVSHSGIENQVNFNPTGAAPVPVIAGYNSFTAIDFASTSDITNLYGISGQFYNWGASDIGFAAGMFFGPYHYGLGRITEFVGVHTDPWSDPSSGGSDILTGLKLVSYGPGAYGDHTDVTGLLIQDFSGIGTASSLNIKSIGGGNWFTGHTAMGEQPPDTFFYSIDDPINELPSVVQAVLGINNVIDTTFGASLLVYPNITSDGGFGIDLEAFISSDNANDAIGYGLFGGLTNYGSGDNSLYGLVYVASHQGSGLVGDAAGIDATGQVGAGKSATAFYAGRFTSDSGAGAAVDTFSTIQAGTSVTAGTVTDLVGVDIADHSGRGTNTSYNLLSRGASSLNVFEGNFLNEGHAAIGGAAAIGTATFAPGDPINEGAQAIVTPLLVNENIVVAGTKSTGAAIWPGFEFATDQAVLIGLDVAATINSDTVGNVTGTFAAMNLYASNLGAGDIVLAVGTIAEFDHIGSGNVEQVAGSWSLGYVLDGTADLVTGGYMSAYASTATDVAVCYIDSEGGGTVTNQYGIYIVDQSGVGSVRSENIRSKGASSLNVFEGSVLLDNYLELTEMVAPSAPAANKGRFFIQDNGGGKSQVCVRFASGAVQVIATEP